MRTVSIPHDLAVRIVKRLEDFNDSGPPCQGYQSQELMNERRAFEAAVDAPAAPRHAPSEVVGWVCTFNGKRYFGEMEPRPHPHISGIRPLGYLDVAPAAQSGEGGQ